MYRMKQCLPGRAYPLTRKEEENGGDGIYTIKIGSRGLEEINELAKFKQKACSQQENWSRSPASQARLRPKAHSSS